MLDGGSGVVINEEAASRDVMLLLNGRNSLELALADANSIIADLETMSGNTKEVLYTDALSMRQCIEISINSVDAEITRIKNIVEDYRARDAKIKQQLKEQEAMSTLASPQIILDSNNARSEQVAKEAVNNVLGAIPRFFGGKK